MTDGTGDPDGTPVGETPGEESPAAAFDDVIALEEPAATAGTVVAAVALLAAFLPWVGDPQVLPVVGEAGSPVGAGLAAGATVAFVLRRHGLLDRRGGSILAGAAGGGLVVYALARLVAPTVGGGQAPAVGIGLPAAAAAGLLCVGFAIGDRKALSTRRLLEMGRRTAVGFGLVASSVVVLYVLVSPLRAVELPPLAGFVVVVLVNDLAIAAVAVAFLVVSRRGLDYVDLSVPDVRDLAYVGLGIVGVFGLYFTIVAVAAVLGLPTADNRIVDAAKQGYLETLLVLIPLSLLVVGPAEELLFRNVIQKYLYGAFTRPGAIVVGSLVFASAHLLSYSDGNPVATLVSLFAVFSLSLVLGAVYERTDNLVVPAVAHGVYNAVLFALLYLALKFAPERAAGDAAVLFPW